MYCASNEIENTIMNISKRIKRFEASKYAMMEFKFKFEATNDSDDDTFFN